MKTTALPEGEAVTESTRQIRSSWSDDERSRRRLMAIARQRQLLATLVVSDLSESPRTQNDPFLLRQAQAACASPH